MVNFLKFKIIRPVLRFICRVLFRIEISGIENYYKAGDRVLITPNHLSFLDGLLLGLFLPESPTFAVNTFAAKKYWLFKIVLSLSDYLTVDQTNPLGIKKLVAFIKDNKKVCIFPEGRLTTTGSLMKIYEGPGVIAHKSNATILPVRIDGAEYTPFSRLKGMVKIKWFPKITLAILPPRKFDINEDDSPREKRKNIGKQLQSVMTDMMFNTMPRKRTLWDSLYDAKAIHGGNHYIAEDISKEPQSYNDLITKSLVLAEVMKRNITGDEENVGILLPTAIPNLVSIFSLQSIDKVPCMLNFSNGTKAVLDACNTANISTIITSNKFVEMAKLEDMIDNIKDVGINLIPLENLKDQITKSDKINGVINAFRKTPKSKTPDDYKKTAIILFTSGSEGYPKGVKLSHYNLLSNAAQIASIVDFSGKDIVLNVLPMFHSFGLSIATLLPLMFGIKVFFYPSPLHYRIVPEVIYDTNATIMFGTNTFLSGYAKFANPYDFYSIRYIFAGAEKLKEEVRRTYSDKFGVRIFEGYGATETGPVISVNTPMNNKPGSVGRIVPGMTYMLEKVPGINTGGELVVSGPNVMQGYLYHPNVPEEDRVSIIDNTYSTGDIITVDSDGFFEIQGRSKRFAKIGGEMVSLSAVEGLIDQIDPENIHAVVNGPDEKKGEKLILFTENETLTKRDISQHARESGISELQVPAEIRHVKVPILGTGKVDYVALNAII